VGFPTGFDLLVAKMQMFFQAVTDFVKLIADSSNVVA
jgi:hypothetical protein